MATEAGSDSKHHSIGEVLAMLKEEHADVTISKIRFFESQGLIDPERTPSGYRKFYEADIERLRWILVQQRDNFLPLKVIKRRLEEAGFDPSADLSEMPLPEPTLFSRGPEDTDGATTEPDPAVADDPEPAPEPEPDPEPDEADPAGSAAAEQGDVEPEAQPDPAAGGTHPETDAEAEGDSELEASMDPASEPDPEPDPDPGPVAVEVPPAPPVAEGDPLDAGAGSVSLSALELAEAAGVDLGLVGDLERLGLITTVGEGNAFDHEALVVARAAGVFMARGVEPRHLRMFKVAAEREAGVLEQLVGPKLKKGGDSRVAARAELNELVQLGETIQRSILRRSFGSQLD